MKLTVVPLLTARKDILDIYTYLSERSDVAGDHFLDCLNRTFEQISEMPELGELRSFHKPSLKNIRVWQVKNFPNYILFYRIRKNQISILRVRHGATNYADE